MLDKYPNEVKLVHKNYPLSIHKLATKAAMAALAAHRQGKFWEYHDKLFENYRNLNDAKFEGLATDLGLNLERFNKDMNEPPIKQLIYRDVKDGREAGVRGIPTIFVNGKLLKNKSVLGFQQMIDAEIKKNK